MPAAHFDQDDALADGIVSAAEYRQSVESARQCLVERGWDVTPVAPEPDGVMLGYGVNWISGGVDPSVDMSECSALFRDDVERAYSGQNYLTGAEKEKELDSLFECFTAIPVDGLLRSDSSGVMLTRAEEQYPDPNSDGFQSALRCLDAHKWAITDQ